LIVINRFIRLLFIRFYRLILMRIIRFTDCSTHEKISPSSLGGF
jgi:hypothetical protein